MSQVCGDETCHKSLLFFPLQLGWCLRVSGVVLWPFSAPRLLAWRVSVCSTSVECYREGQPCASVPSSSYGRGRVRSPRESPNGTTWECAAGCVKDGENTLRNELYHTLLLGMEVTVQQD